MNGAGIGGFKRHFGNEARAHRHFASNQFAVWIAVRDENAFERLRVEEADNREGMISQPWMAIVG